MTMCLQWQTIIVSKSTKKNYRNYKNCKNYGKAPIKKSVCKDFSAVWFENT